MTAVAISGCSSAPSVSSSVANSSTTSSSRPVTGSLSSSISAWPSSWKNTPSVAPTMPRTCRSSAVWGSGTAPDSAAGCGCVSDPVAAVCAGASAAAAGAAAVFAIGIVLSKRWPSSAPLLATTGWQLAAGGLLALPFALVLEGLPPTLSVANLAGYAYLTIFGAIVAYALWFRGIRALPATRVTFLALLSPVVATALDLIVRGQRLTPLQAVGGLIVLGSVVASQLQRVPRPTSGAIAPAP